MKRYVVHDLKGNELFASRRIREAAAFCHTSTTKINRMIRMKFPEDRFIVTVDNETIPDYVWTVVTDDKYEYPIGIYDTLEEMANAIGMNRLSISAMLNHYKEIGRPCRYKKIYIGGDNDD